MDELPTDGFRHHPQWLVGVAALVVAQAGLALTLFGPGRSWAAVADDRPILSGRHPLHLYHGTLGAQAFHHRGATTCYDPAFQAGYPKTPIFDGGCRPAELFLVLAGGEFRPAAYKAGVFLFLLLVPLAFVLAARGAGLPAGAAVLAGAGGMMLGWSGPVRHMLDEGELDFLMAGLGAVVSVAWLARYAKWFGIDSWLVLAGTGAVGWYAHPVVWVALTPVLLGYYVVLAPRRGLAWHLGLLGAIAAGLAPNLWWLSDWVRYWWLRQPAPGDHIPLPNWQEVLGTPADYSCLFGCVPGGLFLVIGGLAGLLVVCRAGHRIAAAALLASALMTVAFARLLAAWPGAPADGAAHAVPLAGGFLVLPAAFGLWTVLGRARAAGVGSAAAVAAFLLVGWADGPARPLARTARLHTDPLEIGFSPEQEGMIGWLRENTTAEARVLWDETPEPRPGWNWTALLPLLTDRAYVGGLDPDAGVEHAFCGMRQGKLNGRPLDDWSDADLAEFCRWYNVGWVVCRGPAAADRWGRLPMAKPAARLALDGRPAVVYVLDRPRSFVLSGSGTWEEAGPLRISLTDVVPNAQGYVELSLHDQDGLRVYPSYITLRDSAPGSGVKDPTGRDPINHVRLWVRGPVPRVTLVWEYP